jgi:hypothetical protein
MRREAMRRSAKPCDTMSCDPPRGLKRSATRRKAMRIQCDGSPTLTMTVIGDECSDGDKYHVILNEVKNRGVWQRYSSAMVRLRSP